MQHSKSWSLTQPESKSLGTFIIFMHNSLLDWISRSLHLPVEPSVAGLDTNDQLFRPEYSHLSICVLRGRHLAIENCTLSSETTRFLRVFFRFNIEDMLYNKISSLKTRVFLFCQMLFTLIVYM